MKRCYWVGFLGPFLFLGIQNTLAAVDLASHPTLDHTGRRTLRCVLKMIEKGVPENAVKKTLWDANTDLAGKGPRTISDATAITCITNLDAFKKGHNPPTYILAGNEDRSRAVHSLYQSLTRHPNRYSCKGWSLMGHLEVDVVGGGAGPMGAVCSNSQYRRFLVVGGSAYGGDTGAFVGVTLNGIERMHLDCKGLFCDRTWSSEYGAETMGLVVSSVEITNRNYDGFGNPGDYDFSEYGYGVGLGWGWGNDNVVRGGLKLLPLPRRLKEMLRAVAMQGR